MSTTHTRIAIESRTLEVLREVVEHPDAVEPAARLEDLDVDSLDLVEVGQVLEEDFGVRLGGDDVNNLDTVADLIELVERRA